MKLNAVSALVAILFTLAMLARGTQTALAAEPMLLADVEQLYPIPQGGRGGGVASMGSARMERLDAAVSPDGRPMLLLAGEQAPVQGAWWFPRHLPMTPQHALIGDARGKIVLEIESAQPVQTRVAVQWRVDGESGEWVSSDPLSLSPSAPVRVSLGIPSLKPGANINGLLLSFDKPGEYRIRRLSIAREGRVLVDPIDPAALRLSPGVKISGSAAPGVEQVTLQFTPDSEKASVVERQASVREGRFELAISANELQPAVAYMVAAKPVDSGEEFSPAQRLFVYPPLTGKSCPPVKRVGPDLVREGKRFGFVGANYTRFLLGLSRRTDYEMVARDVVEMKSFGVRVARVSMDFGMIQPALGVLPDSPEYAQVMRKHNMDPDFVDNLDYFVALAGEMGIYTVIDWHGMATDPYRYFLGGVEQDRGTGKPGTAAAYLAPSPTERGEFDLANPMHVEALLNSHRWAARHFKGNPNVLGIEVPFNEPHTKFMAVEANWRRIVDLCARAIAEEDPEMMTFSLGPSWSHNNLLASVTWLPPDRVTGAAPHFYQANGPVPLRPDAKTMREPWLARESEGTFGWAFTAVMMPFSAVDYPIYNGETGAHGAEMVLPDRSFVEAASILIEAQLVQEYASGMIGRLEWTMWGNKGGFIPLVDVYHKLFNRFAPVYEAGPIDRQHADILFVQHPEAVPSTNGYNHACIPFAKAVLDLHLKHVHYMTDDQVRYIGAAEMPVGIEQVVETAESLKYKAIIVDKRNLDPKTSAILQSTGVPTLWLDNAEELTADRLAEFLDSVGVPSDRKTPRELQLIEGTEHLIVYRRLDGGSNPTRAYPMLNRTGKFELLDESGRSVFSGTVQDLRNTGLEIDLPLWRSAIYRIVSR